MSLLIAILFTFSDWIFHYFVSYLYIDEYAEPQFLLNIFNNPLFWYSIGKFLGTVILGSLVLFSASKKKLGIYLQSVILTLIVVIPLQIRYITVYNYSFMWHVYVILLHMILLYLSSILIMSIFRKRRT